MILPSVSRLAVLRQHGLDSIPQILWHDARMHLDAACLRVFVPAVGASVETFFLLGSPV